MRTRYALPDSVSFLESMRATFPEHPYRMAPYGSIQSLGKLKNQSLSAFYKNLYVPNNMVLAVAGDVRPADVMSQVETAFGAVQRSLAVQSRVDPPAKFAGHTEVEKRIGLKVPRCALTLLTPGYQHPDRSAIEVINESPPMASCPSCSTSGPDTAAGSAPAAARHDPSGDPHPPARRAVPISTLTTRIRASPARLSRRWPTHDDHPFARGRVRGESQRPRRRARH
jgi:hypothetical protein